MDKKELKIFCALSDRGQGRNYCSGPLEYVFRNSPDENLRELSEEE